MHDDWLSQANSVALVQIKMHDCMVRKLDCGFFTHILKNMVSFVTLVNDGLNDRGEVNWERLSMCAFVVMKGKMNPLGIYIL